MRAVDEQRLAVTREVAAKIARLTHRRVDYWADTGLVTPSVDRNVFLDQILPVLERHHDAWVKLSLGVEPEWSFDWR